MQLEFFCPLWGSDHLPFETFLEKVKAAGYDGVEMSFPMAEDERDNMVEAIKKHGLKFIAQHWETVDHNFELHKTNYEKRLRNLAAIKPLFINSQTGKDYYSFGNNCELIDLASLIATETGVKIIHETHRGKFNFAAHVAKQYLDHFPTLKICLDISHWCCVAETMLADQPEAVEAAIQHAHHIHSRVGFTEGPQIMDPRAGENSAMVEQHIMWWQSVVDSFKSKGQDLLTITPEFGAPPYLHLFPYTQQPIYNQWDVNVYMKDLLKRRLNV